MRSSFGRLAQELRLRRSVTQKEFSELAGLSLSHVSNLEHARTNVSDDVVSVYIRVLDCTGDEALELRKRASFSNGVRRSPDPRSPNAPIQVMFEEFGDRLSPKARAEIQRILERETGERLNALLFSSNMRDIGKTNKGKRTKRARLHPIRIVEIALLAEKKRALVCGEMEKLDIGKALEKLCIVESGLDYEVCEGLPAVFDGAFAAIAGHRDGHTLLLEEARFLNALKGVYFCRHVIAHELGHHYLHASLLESENTLWLPPQQLSKNSPATIGSDRMIEQVIDTEEEAEAECFATFFLVPWVAFLKGTDPKYLASDFGEQPDEVKRYADFFRIESFRDQFRSALWSKGIKRHPVFGNFP